MRQILCCVFSVLLLWPLCAWAEPAATLPAFAAAFFDHAEQLETSFEIACAPGLADQLFSDSLLSGSTLFQEITSNCGALTFSYVRQDRRITFSDVRYYEGMRILHAYRSGDLSALNSREQQTLRAALDLVASVSGSDLERERQIHDLLCARVTYYTDNAASAHQEHDCAIGALLNGQADCDGYADAFYLLGGLAGLQVRYQHGNTVPRDASQADPTASKKDVSHMWNTVRIDGQWLMVDVTWDDSDRDVSYLYFNNGQNRQLQTHVWDDRALAITVAAAADDSARPADLRYHAVASWEEVYSLLRSAAESRLSRVCLAYNADFDLASQRQTLSDALYAMGVVDYQWGFGGHYAEVHALTYADHFKICDSEADVLAYIDQCAQTGVQDFAVYFYPPLGQQLFASAHQPLLRLLAQSRLQSLAYQYSENSSHITVSDARYLPAFPMLTTEAEIQAFLQTAALQRSASIVFCTPLSLTPDFLATPLYSAGVVSLSWGENAGRYTLSDLAYYPEFCLVASRQEAADYLRHCAQNGISDFRLYCAPAVYQTLMADQARALFDLLRQQGMANCSVSYNDDYGMIAVKNSN